METASLTDQQIQQRTAYFRQFLSDERIERIEEVLRNRSDYLSVVLEDIYQPHNASAVLRSCDGFGVQHVHVIENNNVFSPSKGVELGTSQWLTVTRHNKEQFNTVTALNHLKSEGYRIIATSPHTDGVALEDVDITGGKMAVVFGTELTGLSKTALDMADEYLHIPMFGFVESFNISVSCALVVHQLMHTLRRSHLPFSLPEREMNELRLQWMRQSVRNPHIHDSTFN
ncbi:MAG: TrmH family RNA methyltransferase [Spirochaetota bacterium]